MAELEVTLEQLESTIVLHAVGPVDSTTAGSLEQPLLHAAQSPSGAVHRHREGAIGAAALCHRASRSAQYNLGAEFVMRLPALQSI